MVALAVNSLTLATAVDGEEPIDDLRSANRQIEEIQNFVSRHEFMEIAYTAAQLRDIVGRNKLAVVLGVELDDLGNMLIEGVANRERVTAELEELYDRGVRYVIPVHSTDNHFGGTAVYEDLFAAANLFHFGSWWDLGCSSEVDYAFELGHLVSSIVDGIRAFGISLPLNTPPLPAGCGGGYVNRRGLTDLGAFAVQEMMRLGMLIDIDHMSQRTADEALSLAESRAYPLSSGHNGLRDTQPVGRRTEYARTAQQYRRIASLRGLAGVGWGGSDARGFLESLQGVAPLMGNARIALGTDVNGLVVGPRAPVGRPVTYSADFPRARTGMRVWDYNDDGVAHYGLLPEFLAHVGQLGGAPMAGAEMMEVMFDGAEAFARTWEISVGVRNALPAVLATGVLLR